MSATEANVQALLRAHAPRAPESLRARVLALEPVPRPRRAFVPARRLALVALPAAAALAVGAAVVYGIAGSGQNGVVAVHERAPSFDTVSSGAVGAAPSAPSLKSSVPATTSARLQHTDASIQVRVADTDSLAAATKRATQIATALGGYAQSVDYRTPQDGGGASYIELRVPSQNVKLALSRLAGLGTLVSQQLSVDDLEHQLQTQSAQIAQLRRRVAELQKALLDMSLPDAQRVLLQIRLAESKRALAQRIHARKGTLAAGATARISLVIGTEKAIVVPHERSRIDRMLHSALGFLGLEAIVLLYVLIVVSPLVLVGGLVWAWRRRSVDRLLAT